MTNAPALAELGNPAVAQSPQESQTKSQRQSKPRTQSQIQAQPNAWKQQTVGHFFARCNWENLELPAVEAMPSGQALVLDYRLSVSQFFGAIPWDGGAMMTAIAAQAAPALEQPAVSEATALDELPELEEIADESHLEGGDVTLDDFLGSFSL